MSTTDSSQSGRTQHEPVERRGAAVVTGAGRGIGRGLALGLVDRGYDVALLGRTASHLEDTARAAAGAAPGAGGGTGGEGGTGGRGGSGPRGRTLVVPVDLVDRAAVADAAQRVADWAQDAGGVGLLVNNAGVIEQREAPFVEDDVDDIWHVVETNVLGPMRITHALLPGMLARGGGRIVNINSGSGHRAGTRYTGYYVSKGALARLTTQLDAQYRDQGLRVFDLAPGVVRTDMTAEMPAHEGRTEWTPVEASLDLLLAVAAGELDALSGRFLRAGDDTPDELAARTYEILVTDARRLRLVSYGPTDPLTP